MACYSGKDGTFKFENNAIGRVRNWSFNATVETLDTTSLGDQSQVYCAGLKSATGSATIWYHSDNSIDSVLNNVITTGAPTSGQLELGWGNKRIRCTAYVNSATISCNTGEVMSADISFQMTGDYEVITL